MHTQDIKKRQFKRRELADIFRHTFSIALVAAFFSGLSGILTSTRLIEIGKGAFGEFLNAISGILPAVTLGFLILSALITVFVTLLQFNIRKASDLRYKVADAFSQALDGSSFNPHRLKEDSHEHKLNSKALG
ncbi:MAG: hypothetical protein LC785_00940 [Acidobacteria bacterium]|nr:hypothetical protein [Acidobacteriota bacterium]MCA1640555.1 hypothetical protein [Acidobacteriota bacterium]